MQGDAGITIGPVLRLIGGFLIVCAAVVSIFGVYNLQSDDIGTRYEGFIYAAAALGSALHGITLFGFGTLIDLQASTTTHLKQLVDHANRTSTGLTAGVAPAVGAASLAKGKTRSFPVPPDGAPYAVLMDPEPIEEGTHRGRRMKTLSDGSVIVERPDGWWRYPSLTDLNRFGGR